MADTIKQNFYCSELAIQVDEQLFGTATRADTWLLLSYAGPFKHKAYEEADIPAPVKAHLDAAAHSLPHTRVQLIKQNSQQATELVFYIARQRD